MTFAIQIFVLLGSYLNVALETARYRIVEYPFCRFQGMTDASWMSIEIYFFLLVHANGHCFSSSESFAKGIYPIRMLGWFNSQFRSVSVLFM